MSKKKARLVLCNNIYFTQYFNVYTHNKPIVNKLSKKYNVQDVSKYYEGLINKSLQYSVLHSHFQCLSIYKKNHFIYNVEPVYFKKYFLGIKNISKQYYTKLFIVNKYTKNYYNAYYMFMSALNNESNMKWFYVKKTRYINKKTIRYTEKQNQNKLIMRKNSLKKLQSLL